MATNENLQAAFAGESQANRKYLAFAKKADQEGLTQVARLFRAAAEAETVHAHTHFRVLGGVQETTANLEAAVSGEAHEFQQMYPDFLAEAESEGNQAAVTTFKNALAVEEIHHGLYTQALESVNTGQDLQAAPIWVCQICGNTVVGDCPDQCGVCGVSKENFVEVS
jgi:rubrerythrin